MKLLHLNTKESFAPHRHKLYSTRAFVSERFSFGLLWDAAPDLWGAVLIPGGTMPCDRKCVRAVVYLLPDTSLRVIGKSLVFPFFFCFLSKSHDVLCSCEPLRLFFFFKFAWNVLFGSHRGRDGGIAYACAYRDTTHSHANVFRLFERATGEGNALRNVEVCQWQKWGRKAPGKQIWMCTWQVLNYYKTLQGRKCIQAFTVCSG